MTRLVGDLLTDLMAAYAVVLAAVALVVVAFDAAPAQPAAAAGGDTRTLSARSDGGALLVTVAEGPHEPRSIGSYALRLYAPRDDRLPYDNFVTGTVRSRDGRVERLVFADVDGDGAAEVVVITRSAGSGGYLAADAFAAGRTGLRFTKAVAGLRSDADPVAALRAVLAPPSW